MRIYLGDAHCQYDLHTADALYHKNCRTVFRTGKIFHLLRKPLNLKIKVLKSLPKKRGKISRNRGHLQNYINNI